MTSSPLRHRKTSPK